MPTDSKTPPAQPPQKATPEAPLKAAALQYDREADAAPRLTARGRGQVAEKILALAKEHDIPVRADADLIEILERVEIGTEIPLEVYAVVAEIFAWLYKTNQTGTAPSAQAPTLPQASPPQA